MIFKKTVRNITSQERIGSAIVKYLVYPNGKTMVFVACNNNPFKLEDEAEGSILYSFLGQVRDRLLYLVTDPHERIVPPIIKWVLTGCDINKDIKVTDMLQRAVLLLEMYVSAYTPFNSIPLTSSV